MLAPRANRNNVLAPRANRNNVLALRANRNNVLALRANRNNVLASRAEYHTGTLCDPGFCDSPRMRRQRVAPGFNLGFPCHREIQGREYGPSVLPMMFILEQESTFKCDLVLLQEVDVFLFKRSNAMIA